MFTSLVLTATLALPGAPVPRATTASGPAPYILTLKADHEGQVRIPVMRIVKEKVQVLRAIGAPGGAQAVEQAEQEVSVQKFEVVGIMDLKDLKIFTVKGDEVEKKKAAEKLTKGAMVVVSANGQKVDPSYLSLFKDDVLVLVSPDLIPKGNMPGYGWGGDPDEGVEVFPVPGIGFPVPPVGVPGAAGGGAGVEVAPAVIAVPAKAVDLPAKKKD